MCVITLLPDTPRIDDVVKPQIQFTHIFWIITEKKYFLYVLYYILFIKIPESIYTIHVHCRRI
jgi:hypothetical protein